MRSIIRLLTTLAALALLAAGPVPPDQLQNLHWRSIGPFRGGRVLAVAGAPDNPQKFYFGAVNGGVWQTLDAGRTWQPIFDAAPVGSIGALAVAPSAPATLYVGTGEADMRSDIAQGAGLFRSTDGGRTWQQAGLTDSQQIGRILVDPRDANTLLVAALGHPYGPNTERGVFRSSDGGRHWARTLFHDQDTGAIDLAAEPDNPAIVYAALWQTRRPPWNVYPPSNGPGSGLYRSVDGGRSWVALTGHGLPDHPGRIGLATTPASPHRVYALIDAAEGGLFRSDDAGATWRRMSQDPRIRKRAWYFSGITADPNNADRVTVLNTIVLRSDDGGGHFSALKGDPTGDDFHALWIDPANPARQILGVDQGAIVTLNGGITWSSWYNQPTGQFYHVSTDNRFPYRVYGAQQDTGAASVASRSDDTFDGLTMNDFSETAVGGESDMIAPDPRDPDVVYGGRVDRLDLKSGQIHALDPTLAVPGAYRATWTLPLAWGRDHALYFANQRIFRTIDGGGHWQPISPDLTRPKPAIPATLDAATAADTAATGPRGGVVYALAPSPLNAKLLWAGTDDGLVWRTEDGGGHWRAVTPKSLAPWSKIGVIEASHTNPAWAYLAIDRHRLDDPAPLILRTRDGGQSWTAITTGLSETINVVREDPQCPSLLYAGSERGVFVSFDDGDHWQSLTLNLPATSVRDLTVHGSDLVIATHGRGFYIMDDMASLRALAAGRPVGPTLFPPAEAYRLHPPGFIGTPRPKDEPLAANPPAGAIIDYYLPAAAAVSMTITDQAGALVRRFSSDDPARPVDPSQALVAPEWLQRPPPPAASPGAHRFVWDLHYAKPPGLTGGEREPEGVWAPPGRYTVALSVAGTASGAGPGLRQVLTLLPDPRGHAPASALIAEFRLARMVEAERAACRVALAAHASLALAALSDRLDALANAVDGADGAPTPDAVSGFHQAERAGQTLCPMPARPRL